jgi:thiamine-phosphate diphosphorylase
MRPLARLHAVTDGAVLSLEDLAPRAAAIAAAGSAVALHVRDRARPARELAQVTDRLLRLVRPPGAAVAVNGRPDIAAALGAQGVQLTRTDLPPADVRTAFPEWRGWLGASVHSFDEARAAVDEGADYLLLGTIFESRSHPGRAGLGTAAVTEVSRLGVPVIALGGVTPERARALRDAGAYGVAAITALWHAPDPYQAALALLAPWAGDAA